MITIRRNNERGSANFGWLDSQHTFSFGSYYDAQQMGFSALRVINDDRVEAGAGFATHGHRDMEIISFVLEGEIAHKDSEGNVTRLPPGEFQLMSAGHGIQHSEFNPSADQALHFLQIWIQPDRQGEAPGYQQKNFGRHNGLTLVASPDGANGSLTVKQDAKLFHVIMPAETTLPVSVSASRKYYIHVIAGDLVIAGATLNSGDGAKLQQLSALELVSGTRPVEALLFDLP